MDKFQKEKIRNLRREGMSYAKIAKQVDVSRDAVISFCRRNGLQEIKKPIPVVNTDAADVCRECGKPLIQVDGMKRRVFCSKECRVKWWKEHPERLNQKAVQFTAVSCQFCRDRSERQHRDRVRKNAAALWVSDQDPQHDQFH